MCKFRYVLLVYLVTMAPSMYRVLLFHLFLCLNFPFSNHVSAQYIQTYVYQNRLSDGTNIRVWRPQENEPWQTVIDVAPSAVYLEYNCAYMTAICRNVRDFFNSDRGNKRPAEASLFVMDFDTQTKSRRDGRSGRRRARSCPPGWVKNQRCPHVDQEPVWRQDGPWWTTAIAPPPLGDNFELAPKPIGTRSNIKYSCDEFPAASWVEGGDGTGVIGNGFGGGPSQTRCAAIRCAPGMNAEQNWQGNAHLQLRRALYKEIQESGRWTSNSPKHKQVAAFYLRTTYDHNGIAARVLTYSDVEHSMPATAKDVRLSGRAEKGQDFHRWADTVTIQELEALGKDRLKQHHIYANGTTFSTEDVGSQDGIFQSAGMTVVSNMTGIFSSTREESPLSRRAAPNPSRKTKFVSITPLAMNATSSSVEKARIIVEDAIKESTRLNAIRLAALLRNNYALKPGTATRLGKTRRSGQIKGNTISPVLQITDEIAAAAALISEMDARNETVGPMVARAAATGSYWMEHLDRKGTVPWGTDPSYKVTLVLKSFIPLYTVSYLLTDLPLLLGYRYFAMLLIMVLLVTALQ